MDDGVPGFLKGSGKGWVIAKLVENVERAMQAVPVLDSEGKPTGHPL